MLFNDESGELTNEFGWFGFGPRLCGCGVLKCTKCENHDLCDTCHEKFKAGELIQHKDMMQINKMSQNFEDHEFQLYKEKNKTFKGITGAKSGPTMATPKGEKKTKPNDPCPCGKGSKYKKCCGKP